MTDATKRPFGLVGLADSDGLGPNVPPNYEDGWNAGAEAQRAYDMRAFLELADAYYSLDLADLAIRFKDIMRELGIEPEEAT